MTFELQIAFLALELGRLPSEILEEDIYWINTLIEYKSAEADVIKRMNNGSNR